MGRWVLAIGAVAATLAALPAAAGAATITVTTASDVSAVQCTLRDAIAAADNDSPAGHCPAGQPAPVTDQIEFSLPAPSTIALGSALPTVTGEVSIAGPGAGQLTISGGNARRVLDFSGTATAAVSGVTITEGKAAEGAGIENEGTLTLDQVAVVGNVASVEGGGSTFPEGGGIRSGSDLTLIRSTVSGNSAIGSGGTGQNGPAGGGIWSNGGLTIEESTVSGNTARAIAGPGGTTNAIGGGIDNSSGKLSIKRSTVSANSVSATGSTTFDTAEGGGVSNSNSPATTVAIEGSTIAGNSATATGSGALDQSRGGGLITFGSSRIIASSTIVGNRAVEGANVGVGKVPVVSDTIIADPLDGESCSEHLESAGYNLEDGTSCGFTKPTDRPKTDPLLSPAGLADNGGPTPTIALSLGSPAINQGLSGPGETIDQRGLPRPLLYPGVPIVTPGGNGADIGAFELQVPVPPAGPTSTAVVPPVAVVPPARVLRIRVTCPKRAKPAGCEFKLQAFSAKPPKHRRKGKSGRVKIPIAETAVVSLKLAPGHSALVTLTPKPKFAATLEAATKVLVREVETVKGATHTSYRRLRLVP